MPASRVPVHGPVLPEVQLSTELLPALDTNGVVRAQIPTDKTFWGLMKTNNWGLQTGTGTRVLSASSIVVSGGYYYATTLTNVEPDLVHPAVFMLGADLLGGRDQPGSVRQHHGDAKMAGLGERQRELPVLVAGKLDAADVG